MGVKFKDKITGFIAEFKYPVDIETTRANPAYDEVFDTVIEEVIIAPVVKRKYTSSSKG
jgi:hypothetical protein